MTLIPKGLKRSEKNSDTRTPAPQEQTSDSESRQSHVNERAEEESFLAVILRIRQGYDEKFQSQSTTKGSHLLSDAAPKDTLRNSGPLTSTITPSLPNETPVLKPPPQTIVLIQEESADSGGVADLWGGTVSTIGGDADIVERVAPAWLADAILRNTIPPKEIVKVSFVLEPWQNTLPQVSSDGNTRLNANRMLRARKILSYVAERIETPTTTEESDGLRPEEYLELYCHDQLIPPTMTLATIRTHVWNRGGDVLLYYKSNGRRKIS